MAKERLSRLQKDILKALLEISAELKEKGLINKGDNAHYEYPSLSILRYLISKVTDKYYDSLFNTPAFGARYLKNIIIARKASVAISRSLVSLDKKGLVILYEISQEVRLTKKGAEIVKNI